MEMLEGDHRFYLQDDSANEVGEITYSDVSDGIIAIDHTGVDESLRGQGWAKKLLNAMIDYADLNNLKIVPVCPYAKHAFKERPEIQRYLAENYQELLKKLEDNKGE